MELDSSALGRSDRFRYNAERAAVGIAISTVAIVDQDVLSGQRRVFVGGEAVVLRDGVSILVLDDALSNGDRIIWARAICNCPVWI